MIVTNIITGIVNFFSVLSLSVTTSSVTSFLGATFILAASIFLEALSLHNDASHIKSLLIFICTAALYIISITGMVFSFVGLAHFVNIDFAKEQSIHIIISSLPDSTQYIAPTDIDAFLACFEIVAIAIPFILACREIILQMFREHYYDLTQGLYGK